MSKEDGILRYKTAMAVFKNWLAEGVLSDADLVEIKGSASPATAAKRPTSPMMRLKPVSSLHSIS